MAYSRKLKAEAEGTYMSRGYVCDLLAAYVLEGYFGWKTAGIYDYIAGGGHNFDRETIGRGEYNSVRSMLSKTFKRLEYRGLVIPSHGNEYASWSGINLTEEGIEKAKELLVSNRNNKEPEK
jgi:hypothetical protein